MGDQLIRTKLITQYCQNFNYMSLVMNIFQEQKLTRELTKHFSKLNDQGHTHYKEKKTHHAVKNVCRHLQ